MNTELHRELITLTVYNVVSYCVVESITFIGKMWQGQRHLRGLIPANLYADPSSRVRTRAQLN